MNTAGILGPGYKCGILGLPVLRQSLQSEGTPQQLGYIKVCEASVYIIGLSSFPPELLLEIASIFPLDFPTLITKVLSCCLFFPYEALSSKVLIIQYIYWSDK